MALASPAKIRHIFGNPDHNLAVLESEFGTSEAAYAALETAVQVAVQRGQIEGLFEIQVGVGSSFVTVRGLSAGQSVRIGTAFIPD